MPQPLSSPRHFVNETGELCPCGSVCFHDAAAEPGHSAVRLSTALLFRTGLFCSIQASTPTTLEGPHHCLIVSSTLYLMHRAAVLSCLLGGLLALCFQPPFGIAAAFSISLATGINNNGSN